MELQESDCGRTALHCAATYGHPDVVRMLLSRGADPSVEDRDKRDAAFLARKEGHHECRQILAQQSRERITALAGQAMIVSFIHSYTRVLISKVSYLVRCPDK